MKKQTWYRYAKQQFHFNSIPTWQISIVRRSRDLPIGTWTLSSIKGRVRILKTHTAEKQKAKTQKPSSCPAPKNDIEREIKSEKIERCSFDRSSLPRSGLRRTAEASSRRKRSSCECKHFSGPSPPTFAAHFSDSAKQQVSGSSVPLALGKIYSYFLPGGKSARLGLFGIRKRFSKICINLGIIMWAFPVLRFFVFGRCVYAFFFCECECFARR